MNNDSEEYGGGDHRDPLDGAAIGEKRTVTESKTLHGINFEPDVFYGSDREGRPEIVDVEVVKDEREGYADDIRVTWEADMTKTLGRNWDKSNQPRTEEEAKQQTKRKWLRRAGKAATIAIPAAISVGVASHMMNALAGSMTVNGEAVTAPSTPALAGLVGLVILLAAFIQWATSGGQPPKWGASL